jgi:hypothetical protein
MQTLTFTYHGKEYAGYIASSTIKEPHFHWLFFTDRELTETVGDDCVAFREKDGELEHFNRIPLKHSELVQIAHRHIEEYLQKK